MTKKTLSNPLSRHRRGRVSIESLRAEIAAGLASGGGEAADALLDRLEAKYRRIVDA